MFAYQSGEEANVLKHGVIGLVFKGGVPMDEACTQEKKMLSKRAHAHESGMEEVIFCYFELP